MKTLIVLTATVDPSLKPLEVRIPVSQRLDHLLVGDVFRLSVFGDTPWFLVNRRKWDGRMVLILECTVIHQHLKYLSEKGEAIRGNPNTFVLPEQKW